MSGPADPPDDELVRATLRGDEAAFAALVRRYLRKAMAVALEFAGTREDAEDIVQDTFRRVFENLDRYDTRRSFEPWFFTILRNTARNALKSRLTRAHEELSPEQAASVPGPFENTRQSELRARIAEAVSELPPMQQTCFRLCLVEGLSSVEAANAMGLAESTVRVHVFKARQTLRELLDSWRGEVEEA
jgi:RNA polymerase sigma-70 factor (ECF subfamily)